MASEIKIPGVLAVGTGDHWGTTSGLKDAATGKMQSAINADVQKKYEKPAGGIPLADISDEARSTFSADSAASAASAAQAKNAAETAKTGAETARTAAEKALSDFNEAAAEYTQEVDAVAAERTLRLQAEAEIKEDVNDAIETGTSALSKANDLEKLNKTLWFNDKTEGSTKDELLTANKLINKLFIDYSGFKGDASLISGGLIFKQLNIGKYYTGIGYYYGFRICLANDEDQQISKWVVKDTDTDRPRYQIIDFNGIYIYIEYNWEAVGDKIGTSSTGGYYANKETTTNPNLDNRSGVDGSSIYDGSVGRTKLDSSILEDISYSKTKVDDLSQKLESFPTNDVVGLDTTSPNFVPIQGKTVSATNYGSIIITDTDSPFKDLIGKYTVISDSLNTGSSFRWENSYDKSPRTNRPNKIKISVWTKKSEYSNLGNNGMIAFCISNKNVKLDMITVPILSVINGKAWSASRSVSGLYSCTRKCEKVYETGDWCQLLFSWDNIVWSDSNWMFGFAMTGVQQLVTSISLCNLQIVFDEDEIIAGITVLPDGSTLSQYPVNPIDEIKRSSDKNAEDIEELKTQAQVRDNILHYEQGTGLSYILSPFSNTCDIKLELNIRREGTLSVNNCLNFLAIKLINKTTSAVTTLTNCFDDICPSSFNGTYIGANHGCSDLLTLTCTNHGKTVEDIGSVWSTSDGKNCTIVSIKDVNNINVLGDNNLVYPLFNHILSITSQTLTHVSGATHTGDIMIDADANGKPKAIASQFKNAIVMQNTKVYADGNEITESGDYKFKHLDICETYDIPNVASVLNAIKEGVGTFSSNPKPSDFTDADKVARHAIVYGFDSASDWKYSTDFIAYQNIKIGYFGFTQMLALEGNALKMYIPKALPISNGQQTLDFRTIANHNSVPQSMNFTSEYWENPLSPPDRWIQFSELGGVHSGYLFDYGVGGVNRKDMVKDAILLYTSKKCYPHGIDDKITVNAGDSYSAVVWRKYIDASKINKDGCIATNVFEYNNNLYIYADYNASGVYDIEIPSKWVGKAIDVYEKSNNLTLFNKVSSNLIQVKVNSATPMYGYLVAKIK